MFQFSYLIKFTLEMNLNPTSHQNHVKTVLKTGFKFRKLSSVLRQSWIFVDRETCVKHVSARFSLFLSVFRPNLNCSVTVAVVVTQLSV